jgi:cholesterol oxidase
MGALTTALADADPGPRALTWAREYVRNFVSMMRNLVPRHWSEQTIIALVMQARNNSITCYTKPGLFGRHLTTREGDRDERPPVAGRYVRVKMIAPRAPFAPAGAPGELRL